MRRDFAMTEADAIDHARRNGLALDPTLTVRTPPAPARELDPESPEAALESRVQIVADAAGWLRFHVQGKGSRRSAPGFPDDVLVHPDGGPLYFWEYKRADGQLSPAQRRWLDALRQVTHIETGVYRPADWAALCAKLRRNLP
jgi:VRR-NUC domain